MKRFARTILKASFALLLLALLYRKADGHAFGAALRGLRWRWCVPFFAILACNTWISAVRWGLLLRADGVRVRTGKLFASYLISSFFNFFLPSNVGGDVYRIADLASKSGRGAGSLASVFADRLCGFLALSLMGFAFPLAGLRMVPAEKRPLLLVPLAVFLGFLCLAALALQPWLARLALRMLPPRFRAGAGQKVESFFQSMRAYANDRKGLAGALALSLWIQLFVLLAIWCVARALALPVTLAECGVFVPFVCLLEAVPVSINGIGLRDAGYMLFFTAVELGGRGADPAASAAALSLCYMAFTLAYSCAGGLLFLNRLFRSGGGGARPKRSAAPSGAALLLLLAVAGLSAAPLPLRAAMQKSAGLPGFGRNATYEISPLPSPDDLKRATARAEAVADAADEASSRDGDDAEDDPFAPFMQLAASMVLARERALKAPSFRTMAIGAMEGLIASFDEFGAVERSGDNGDPGPNDSEDGYEEGLGLTLDLLDSTLAVRLVQPDSPAYHAGIRAGDRILAADGVAIRDMADFDSALVALVKEDGEPILLRCEKPGAAAPEPFEARLSPAMLHIPSVSASRVLPSGFGYALVDEFREDTPNELARILFSELQLPTLPGLVLDLRGNPGGLLDAATEIAAWFLPDGAALVSTRGRLPEQDDSDVQAEGDGPFSTLPVAVLVDSETASAAEIVAVALQQSGGATIIGEKTFGKGCVQDSFSPMEGAGHTIRLTVAEWLSPNGNSIRDVGLEPDIEIAQNDDVAWRVRRLNILESHPETARREELANLRAPGPDAMLEAAVADLLRRIAENARAQAGEAAPEKEEEGTQKGEAAPEMEEEGATGPS